MKKMVRAVLFVVVAFFSSAVFAEDEDPCASLPVSLTLATDGYYEIGTADELYKFACMVNNGAADINGRLTADIVVNENLLGTDNANVKDDGTFDVETYKSAHANAEPKVWPPIGTLSTPYAGTFDGNGKTISGLYFNDKNAFHVGLFGDIGYGAVVQNVGVVDSYIKGSYNVGGVVGFNDGTVSNVYNTGMVSCENNSVGGVVGENGGIGTVSNVYNTGAVSGISSVGGVVGLNMVGTISNVYNTGAVNGGVVVGGVVGDNSGTVSNVYNMGSVNGDVYVGGVVGENGSSGTVSNVYNTGAMSGNNYVGGVVGHNERATVENVYNTGVVSGAGSVGGVVGDNSGTVSNVYNTGAVSGDNRVGSVVGENGGPVNSAYYNTDMPCENCGSPIEGTNGMATAELASLDVANAFDNSEGVWIAGEETRSGGWLTYTFPSLKNVGTALKNVLLDPGASEVEISNAEELFRFAEFVNGGETSINGKLTADICVNACDEGERVLNDDGTLNEDDASKFVKWIPIGTDVNSFAGTFDGDGHTIRGLYFNDASVNDVGLFGKVLAVTIQNVGIEDSYINGGEGVGALAGTIASGSRVSDVYNAGSVSGKMIVGGIIGKVEGSEVSDAHNAGAVTTEEYSAGGVVGDVVKSTIANAYNTGDVSGPEWIGGVVGSGSGFTVSQVYNAGEISGSQAVGGLVGTFTSKSSLRNAYNIGKVRGDDRVGGVFGYVYEGAIVYVYSKGEVIAEENGGGLIGFFDSGTIDSSYFDEAIYAGEAVGINKYGLGITGTEVLGKTSDELVAGTSLKLDTTVWVLGGVGVGTTNDSLYYPYLKVFGPHEYVLSDVKKYAITVAVNDKTMGSVTGAGVYEYGTEVEITATANEGYKFVKWSDGVKDAKRAIMVTKAEKLTATFEKDSKKDAVVAMAQLPQFSVTASGKMVSIAGGRPNTNVVVYDLQGNRVKTVVATVANFTFTLPSAGVYIVKNGYTAKRVNVR